MKSNKFTYCVVFIVFTFTAISLKAQRRNSIYESYFDTYRELAKEQMKRHSVPASITLAQGVFESGAGKSELAVKANNHFGIKKGAGWSGKTIVKADDRPDDLFRVYGNVRESFEDHSNFLHQKRYSRLFELNILDYKGWAKGLKECGYATNPHYAQRLIDIIELYELYLIDQEVVGKRAKHNHNHNHNHTNIADNHHQESSLRILTYNNNLPCTIAREGDDWNTIADEMHISRKRLMRYNEACDNMQIVVGTYIYLHKKARKGPKEMKKKWHRVAIGESMYSISQLYGVRVKSIYKMNFKNPDYIPIAGELIKVR